MLWNTAWTYYGVTFLTVVAAVYGLLQLKDYLLEKYSLKKINTNLMPRLESKTKKFLKKELSIEYERKFKAIKGDKFILTDSAILFPIHNPQSIKSNDCPVDVIEVIIAQVQQTIISVLSERGYDSDASKETAEALTEEFLTKEIYESEIRNETTKREIKTKFSTAENKQNKELIKQNISVIKDLIKKNVQRKEFYSQYKKSIESNQTGTPISIQELVKKESNSIVRDKIEGEKVIFSQQSMRIMKNMREQRLKSHKNFLEYYGNLKTKKRSEQLYGIILDKWGIYISEIYTLNKVPTSTSSRYIASMESEELLIKMPRVKEHFFRKEIYPVFTQKEIENSYEELSQSEQIAIFGKVQKKNEEDIYFLDKYPNIKININNRYFGKNVVVIGKLSKEVDKIILKDIHICEK